MLVAGVIALASCKARSELPIGAGCTDDKECATGLYCAAGLGKGMKCLKACGPSKTGEMYADEDTTCPKGWSCSATLARTYKDESGKEQPAFLGLTDRPACVPDGWTPEN